MDRDDASRVWALLRAEGAAWAMAAGHLESLAALVAQGPVQRPARRPQTAPRATALIPVVGPLMRRGSVLTEMLGLSSYQDIRARLAKAAADPSVGSIILYVDSPGGVAGGAEEAAAEIAAAARRKPVVAFVDGMAGSAAYWLASAASEVVVTPSGEVGSIGVFALRMDASRMLDRAGLTPTFIVSRVSPRKVEANELEALSADARARAQADADAVAAKFVRDVARGRGVPQGAVVEDFGQGGMVSAQRARIVGMVDKVGTLDVAVEGAVRMASAAQAAARGRRLALLKA